jgi:1-deoxyxylulose-5-phosphate synthase
MPVELAFKGLNVPGQKAQTRPNMQGLSRKRILAAVDASLRRLGMDWIDLYQIHRFDPATPVEETMQALHDVVKAGKVRYIGASSMWAWQFAKMQQVAREHGWTSFVSMQNHYNLLYREEERETNPLCIDQGVGLLPWSPLARGFLAGNRRREDRTSGATSRAQTDEIAQSFYYQDSDFAVVEALKAVADARGESMARVAYAWLLGRPGVTAPIVGASKAWQLEEAVSATELALSADELRALEGAYRPHPVLGHT